MAGVRFEIVLPPTPRSQRIEQCIIENIQTFIAYLQLFVRDSAAATRVPFYRDPNLPEDTQHALDKVAKVVKKNNFMERFAVLIEELETTNTENNVYRVRSRFYDIFVNPITTSSSFSQFYKNNSVIMRGLDPLLSYHMTHFIADEFILSLYAIAENKQKLEMLLHMLHGEPSTILIKITLRGAVEGAMKLAIARRTEDKDSAEIGTTLFDTCKPLMAPNYTPAFDAIFYLKHFFNQTPGANRHFCVAAILIFCVKLVENISFGTHKQKQLIANTKELEELVAKHVRENTPAADTPPQAKKSPHIPRLFLPTPPPSPPPSGAETPEVKAKGKKPKK